MKLLYIAPSLPRLLHLDMRRGRPAETRAANAQVVMPDPAESLRCSGESQQCASWGDARNHVMIWDAIFELSRWYSWWNLSHYLHTGFDTSQVCRIQYFRGQLIRPTSSHLIQPNSRLLLRVLRWRYPDIANVRKTTWWNTSGTQSFPPSGGLHLFFTLKSPNSPEAIRLPVHLVIPRLR